MRRGKYLTYKFCWVVVLLFLAFIHVSNQPVVASPRVIASSCEMRLSLNPQYFKSPESYQAYWALVKSLASDRGLIVKEHKKPFKEKRQINSYYDTLGKDLYKQNYILRERRKIKSGIEQSELTLKYRIATEKLSLTNLPLYSSLEQIKYEEDWTGFVDGRIGKNKKELSLSHTVKNNKGPVEARRLSNYIEMFPELNYLEINLQEPLYLVSGQVIKEISVNPGSLYLEETELPIEICIWLSEKTDEVIAAEISWKYGLPLDETRISAIEEFFVALQVCTKDFLIPGRTKTNVVANN